MISIIGERCSHGKTWSQECPDCKLVSAHEMVRHWGRAVDEARKVIAESEKTTEGSDELF